MTFDDRLEQAAQLDLNIERFAQDELHEFVSGYEQHFDLRVTHKTGYLIAGLNKK